MKKVLLLLFSLVGILNWSAGQVYLDQFDNDDPAFTTTPGGFTFSEASGELTITGDGTGDGILSPISHMMLPQVLRA